MTIDRTGIVTDANLAVLTADQGELPSSDWRFDQVPFGDDDIVAEGADLEVTTLVDAYASGLFPMPIGRHRLGWFSPVIRGVIPLDGLRVSRSLAKSCRRFSLTLDRDFTRVMQECADPRRDHGWIDDSFVAAYTTLHRLGFAHSVEVWRGDELVGGVYGVRIRRFFAGESMFHRATDASKVALVGLVDLLRASGFLLFDVQWTTPHLASLGAIDIPRAEYLASLADAVNRPDRRQTGNHG